MPKEEEKIIDVEMKELVEVIPDVYRFMCDSHWVNVDNDSCGMNDRITLVFVTPKNREVRVEMGLKEAKRFWKEIKTACKLVELAGE